MTFTGDIAATARPKEQPPSETLRHQDREAMTLWKAVGVKVGSPKG